MGFSPNLLSITPIQLVPSVEYAILPLMSPATNLLSPYAIATMVFVNVLFVTAFQIMPPPPVIGPVGGSTGVPSSVLIVPVMFVIELPEIVTVNSLPSSAIRVISFPSTDLTVPLLVLFSGWIVRT
jgi:hypothetical protein